MVVQYSSTLVVWSYLPCHLLPVLSVISHRTGGIKQWHRCNFEEKNYGSIWDEFNIGPLRSVVIQYSCAPGIWSYPSYHLLPVLLVISHCTAVHSWHQAMASLQFWNMFLAKLYCKHCQHLEGLTLMNSVLNIEWSSNLVLFSLAISWHQCHQSLHWWHCWHHYSFDTCIFSNIFWRALPASRILTVQCSCNPVLSLSCHLSATVSSVTTPVASEWHHCNFATADTNWAMPTKVICANAFVTLLLHLSYFVSLQLLLTQSETEQWQQRPDVPILHNLDRLCVLSLSSLTTLDMCKSNDLLWKRKERFIPVIHQNDFGQTFPSTVLYSFDFSFHVPSALILFLTTNFLNVQTLLWSASPSFPFFFHNFPSSPPPCSLSFLSPCSLSSLSPCSLILIKLIYVCFRVFC